MIIHTNQGSVTTVAGTISANLTAGHGILMQMFVKPATTTTTFDVTLTDIYDNVILTREDQTEDLNETLLMPTYGNLTFTISNASADEAFDYLFAIRENR